MCTKPFDLGKTLYPVVDGSCFSSVSVIVGLCGVTKWKWGWLSMVKSLVKSVKLKMSPNDQIWISHMGLPYFSCHIC